MLQIPARAGDQIIQRHHFVAIVQQPVAEMRADKAGCPRYEISQISAPRIILTGLKAMTSGVSTFRAVGSGKMVAQALA